VVVDEQHRFGVRQRMALGERETNPDVLIMSATPIPRTLAMTLYGDLDLSVIDELPPGRKPIRTRLFYPSKRKQVWRFVEERLAEGHQAFVVYPLVEESEKVELRAATEEFDRLSTEEFPERRLGLVHGQMPSEAKDDIMRRYRDREIDLLVATSVIEVGIDVPNATVMVIEHAERFGLSQLHQLRGRVGRGSGESHCLLIAEPGEMAAERLAVFVRTQDGFEIAREDLRIRGQGDLFGSQQHGKDAILSFADLMADGDLLAVAQTMARDVVGDDPELQEPANAEIREVFEARYRERLRLFMVG
jgi:ATP-dependent DNA helicase RecG